jgi:lysylphosphatidylglycerol synthetase-like protein (DUF2156 family)
MAATFSVFPEPTPSFWRSLQTLNISRVIIAISLLLLLNLRSTKDIWVFSHVFAIDICTAYLISSWALILKVVHTRHFILQLLSQITLDIIIISLLYLGRRAWRLQYLIFVSSGRRFNSGAFIVGFLFLFACQFVVVERRDVPFP